MTKFLKMMLSQNSYKYDPYPESLWIIPPSYGEQVKKGDRTKFEDGATKLRRVLTSFWNELVNLEGIRYPSLLKIYFFRVYRRNMTQNRHKVWWHKTAYIKHLFIFQGPWYPLKTVILRCWGNGPELGIVQVYYQDLKMRKVSKYENTRNGKTRFTPATKL